MKRHLIASLACGLMAMAGAAQAADALTGTTTLSLNVPAEAALSITNGTTGLTTSGGIFGSDFTGTTRFLYKIRTGTQTTAKITMAVTSDFGSTLQPRIASLPNTDTLTFACTATAPSGAGCTDPQPISALNSPQTVVTFIAQAHSTKNGDEGTVAWTLTNDPVYEVGAFTATVLFTISAT